MELQPIGSNQTELRLANGTRILFSYRTPVAAYVPGRGYIKSGTRYSVTTSRHVNQWIGAGWQWVPQEEIDGLVPA